jgi:hypothetical protein
LRSLTIVDNRSTRLVGLALVALGLLGLVFLGDRVAAQTEPPDNQTGKTVTVKPNPKAAGNPVTTLTHFEHAWWDTANPFAGLANYTAGQAPGFSGFGYDSVIYPAKRDQPDRVQNAGVFPDAKGQFPKGTTQTPVTLVTRIVTPNPPNGKAQNFNFQAQAGTPPNDHATAKSLYTLSPYQADGKTFTRSRSRVDGDKRAERSEIEHGPCQCRKQPDEGDHGSGSEVSGSAVCVAQRKSPTRGHSSEGK